VSFISQGVTLRGTLYLPNETPFAAVVWVDGAGETKRNPGLGQFLAHRGLALLTYDKRGVGESGGVYAGPQVGTNNVSLENLGLLASDAAAALRSVRRDKTLRRVPLGFIGGSQAGWIIPLAALKNHGARFMVLWSGAVETTHGDVLFEQLALPDPTFWDHHSHDEVQTIMAKTEDHLAWPSFDPRDALSRLKIPGLWVFGGRDRNVDVDRSVAPLKKLIAAGHSNYSYRMIPEYDHGLGGERKDVVDPSLAWIREMVGRP
jgi:alpha-beta hydrolase superfamily lysophospholipase